MNFEVFKEKVTEIANKANMKARFSSSDGKHVARFSDGTVIIGNSTQLKVTVRWNSGNHQAVTAI